MQLDNDVLLKSVYPPFIVFSDYRGKAVFDQRTFDLQFFSKSYFTRRIEAETLARSSALPFMFVS
ncbi:MAG: hypothetical protein EA359_12265 [Balneolaceae bacterium]|nr:MAG: hypothetical protein EA359_12265 [Balneolaceae bacterium]